MWSKTKASGDTQWSSWRGGGFPTWYTCTWSSNSAQAGRTHRLLPCGVHGDRAWEVPSSGQRLTSGGITGLDCWLQWVAVGLALLEMLPISSVQLWTSCMAPPEGRALPSLGAEAVSLCVRLLTIIHVNRNMQHRQGHCHMWYTDHLRHWLQMPVPGFTQTLWKRLSRGRAWDSASFNSPGPF